MEGPSAMILQPVHDGLVLVGGIVVQNGVDRSSGRHLPVDLVEERDELLMPVALGVAVDHRSIQGVQRDIQAKVRSTTHRR